jgi:hypothetical protein
MHGYAHVSYNIGGIELLAIGAQREKKFAY